jgi:hypothetical protein
MRASELSVLGKWIFRKDNPQWLEKKDIITRYLGSCRTINSDTSNSMKNCAKEMYFDLEHLMTNTEKRCFLSMLNRPIWKSGNRELRINKEDSTVDDLESLVISKTITASTRNEYYSTLADMLNTTPDTIRERLSKLDTKWDKKAHTYNLRESE